jgi:hypothetical protein
MSQDNPLFKRRSYQLIKDPEFILVHYMEDKVIEDSNLLNRKRKTLKDTLGFDDLGSNNILNINLTSIQQEIKLQISNDMQKPTNIIEQSTKHIGEADGGDKDGKNSVFFFTSTLHSYHS